MSSSAERRQRVLDEIAKAAKVAKRDPKEVQLVAVSKGRTAAEIEPLIDAGQRDFGENRVQEALAKWPQLLASILTCDSTGSAGCSPTRPRRR